LSAARKVAPVHSRALMEAFLVSISSVAIAEMGDRTQLLSLVLAARYRRPWPILLGVLLATLASHTAAGIVGRWLGKFLTVGTLDVVVGVSMLAMALWTLKPDKLESAEGEIRDSSVLVATFVAFFVAEMGDKTQIATLALAAAYPSLIAVIAGTTCGMLLANAPVVFLGKAFADRLPLKAIHLAAAVLFAVLGVLFIVRGVR
jgi:Ca2+/H+ antiporter, TMEM165/GDT1 family